MTSTLLSRWQSALHLSAVLVFLGGVCSACVGARGLPTGCEAGAPPSSAAALKACLTGLAFDTLEAAGDKQVLTIIENGPGSPCPGRKDETRSCRYGPLATIQPEMNSFTHKYDALHQVRIIARLFIPRSEKDKYDSLALAPGATTYWWVQVTKTQREFESAGSGHADHPDEEQPPDENKYDGQGKKEVYGRSFFISQRGDSLVIRERPLYYRKHKGKFKQALARWVWDPDDETSQGSCGQGCCR
jgi:hypothetical protein